MPIFRSAGRLADLESRTHTFDETIQVLEDVLTEVKTQAPGTCAQHRLATLLTVAEGYAELADCAPRANTIVKGYLSAAQDYALMLTRNAQFASKECTRTPEVLESPQKTRHYVSQVCTKQVYNYAA